MSSLYFLSGIALTPTNICDIGKERRKGTVIEQLVLIYIKTNNNQGELYYFSLDFYTSYQDL